MFRRFLLFPLVLLLSSGTPRCVAQVVLPACTATDCNCSDFATQADAQRVLDAVPGDPYRLD